MIGLIRMLTKGLTWVWGMNFKFITFLILLTLAPVINATGVYQEPNDFLKEVFNGSPPKAKRLWIKQDLKTAIKRIMERDLGVVRLRYWQASDKTVWILEEIGKEKPITTGLVISNNQIESLRVLIFRESRGWEIKYPFFTDQFKGVKLNPDKQLNKHIDAITGATLSRNAMIKLSRLALHLTDYVQHQ